KRRMLLMGRYNVVPPPAADLYRSPKKDLSWTGLPEFDDDTVTDYSRPSPTVESTLAEGQNKNSTTAENGESTDSNLSKPVIKFVKASDKPAERPTTNIVEFVKVAERPTTDKVETAKKPAVRYAEMYRRTSKRSNVRGNQRNWNNLKSQQLGPDFVMKKKACYNCYSFKHEIFHLPNTQTEHHNTQTTLGCLYQETIRTNTSNKK
nr:hypothetical protein [Tanacetum cinerariifolium]